ncbi:MAG: hypothetical protein Q8L86_13180 [Vicinamibacterales bacterium]|nr:hypothetical protein [Vicinamibacterales bacterium]
MEETAARMADGEDLRDAVPREAVISLSRNRPDDWADRVIYVWLNGARLDPIRYGATLHLSVPPGRHTVKVHNTLRGRTLEIEAAPGEHIRLSCGNQTAAGGFLMMLMMGVAALRVRLDREGAST